MTKKWIPLESNPEVLNEFVAALGIDVSRYSFSDVFGLDEVSYLHQLYLTRCILLTCLGHSSSVRVVDCLRKCLAWCQLQS